MSGHPSRVHTTLPIFRLDDDGRAVFYTPGQVLVTTPAQAADAEAALRTGSSLESDACRLAGVLVGRARAAVRAWHELAGKPFEPECLTLYLSNRCNLGCQYCYSAPVEPDRKRLRMYRRSGPDAGFPTLSESVVYAAARVVARHCARQQKPLTLVFHGGGEPTLHWSLLERVHAGAGLVAREHGIRLWSYVATNGVLAEDRARWLAGHFDLVGLSCDGPPEIQNANRPSAGGAATAHAVERTARVLAVAGAGCTVRATITPSAVRRQVEILIYACERLFARSVRFEPAYGARHVAGEQFRPDDAPEFVAHFLEAVDAARQRGCDLQLSGVRIDEIHGPFCNPLRQTLQLTPDGIASACFLSSGNDDAEDAPMAMGHLDAATGEFVIDQDRAAAIRRQAARVPARCEACVNVYHCARDCPDVCVVTADPVEEQQAGFRCRVQKLLGYRSILQLAAAVSA